MSKFYNIEDRSDIVRDGHSKAIIAHDPNILVREKARMRIKAQKVEMDQRISRLENDMAEIKDLLRQIINK
jgi:hypothetical protein